MNKPGTLVFFWWVVGKIIMTFSNTVSSMVKILTLDIIMTRIFTISLTLVLKLHNQSHVWSSWVRNQETTINNKVRATEQIFVLDPVN